jgi:pectate lyase
MKQSKICSIFLTFILLAFLAPETGFGKTIDAGSIQSINDAIAIAEKGDTILLKEGIYKFGKGKPGLAVINKKGLHLKGEGRVVIQSNNSSSPNLTIRQSSDIRIENIAFAQQRGPGKSVDAIQIQNSTNIRILDCLVHSPKGDAIDIRDAADVLVRDSIFYDALRGLLSSHDSLNLVFTHNLVWKNSGGELVFTWKNKNVRFSDNLFAYNKMTSETIKAGSYNITRTMIFASFYESPNIQFDRNYFSENGFNRVLRFSNRKAKETFQEIPVQLVGPIALNSEENLWPDEKFKKMAKRLSQYKKQFPRLQKNRKKVKTSTSFSVNQPAAGNKTTVLHPGDDINRAIKNAGAGETIILSPGVYAFHTGDTPVDIVSKQNLLLTSEGKAYILCTDPNSTPLFIGDSRNILIENIHFGHALQRGTCAGRVSIIEDSSNVTLRNCTLHGSGIVAIEADRSRNILVEGCALVQCTESVLRAWNTSNLLMKNNFIAENDNSWPAAWGGKNAIFTSSRASNLQIHGNLIYKNQTEFVPNWNDFGFFFTGNVFAENSFTLPPEILKNRANRKIGVPKNIELDALMLRSDLWPDDRVKEAAKDYLEFLKVLKEFESNHR